MAYQLKSNGWLQRAGLNVRQHLGGEDGLLIVRVQHAKNVAEEGDVKTLQRLRVAQDVLVLGALNLTHFTQPLQLPLLVLFVLLGVIPHHLPHLSGTNCRTAPAAPDLFIV